VTPLFRKLLWLLRRPRKEDDLREELQFHLDEEAEQRLEEQGLTMEQAKWAARRDLGNLALVQEDTRAMWIWTWLEQLVQDLRHALRNVLRNRGFTMLSVLTMALGIGANTAIYSFMDFILLRALPVADPKSLVVLTWHSRDPGEERTRSPHVMHSMDGESYNDPATGMTTGIFPYPFFEAMAKKNDVFSSVMAHYPSGRRTLQIRGRAHSVEGEYVSGDYFRGLAVVPAAGRLIVIEDDRAGAPPVAVVSYAFSNRLFGGPTNTVGQSILIDRVPFSVAGVVPREFFGVDPATTPDFYLPMHTNLIGGGSFTPSYTDPNYYWVEIMGRLRPGVALQQAQATLAPQFHQWLESTAANDAERANLPALLIKEGSGGLDSLRRQYSKPLFVLLAMTGLMLALACANTANLLLARATSRRREMAVRLSLGAGRLRIVRQLLTESVLLASLGGALGVLVAVWGIRFLTLLLTNGRENFTLRADLNWHVLGVTLAISLLSGVLFGLAPAVQSTRTEIVPELKEARVSGSRKPVRLAFFRIKLNDALVTAQIAISLLILVAAGLFVRTLSNLQSIQVGFNRENMLLFQINAKQAGYQDERLLSFYAALQERFEAVPGIRNASLSHASLLTAGRQHAVSVAGTPAQGARILYAGPSFFATMQIPMLLGRDISPRDKPGLPGVAAVNERFAKANFGDRNPLGRHISVSIGGPHDLEIVGVCANARYGGLKRDFPPVVFVAYRQVPPGAVQGMTYALRTVGDPLRYLETVRQMVNQADARIPVTDVKTQASEIDGMMNQEIIFARLCSGFAAIALAIACVGLYGTMSYQVGRRTAEIGIRMALGADRGAMVWMVLRDVLGLAAAGLAVGLPMALGAGKFVESFLFGLQPYDPRTLGLAVFVLVSAALLAGFIPAWKASRIDPMIALRQE
jgi:macrolide transport system ATP-binding/permease protein